MKISNRKRIKVLESAKDNLLQQKGKGLDVAKMLDIVNERIKYYKELGKILRKNKKTPQRLDKSKKGIILWKSQ